MDDAKKIDKRENIKLATHNSLIEAPDLAKLSLNARKLFYVAVSQCKMSDTEFYEYETTPPELAEMWGIDRSRVYREAEKICKELMGMVITLKSGKKSFKMRHLYEKCDYDDDSVLVFKLHPEMTDLLLGLKKDFSQPLVWDFMRMRSPYSMAIWHLFQKEMQSFKPMMNSPIEFELSLEELRKVTGTENKFKQVGQFKQFVLDKAIKEIRKNCWVEITYRNKKRGRSIDGFYFTAKSIWGSMTDDELPHRLRKRLRLHDLKAKTKTGSISPEEFDELQELILELGQLSLEDIMNNYPLDD